jgi:CDP-diacylglycerol--serine O-phosphatidyltransferase
MTNSPEANDTPDSRPRPLRAGAYRFAVPNVITATNLALGSTSVFLSVCGRVYWAGWLVMLSVLLDKLDGTVARLLSASSRFGVEFDSLADLVAFGLAPATFVFSVLSAPLDIAESPSMQALLAISCGIYVLAAAVRLARFNVESTRGGAEIYFGIPMPMAGGLITALLLVLMKYAPSPLGYSGWAGDIRILGDWRAPELILDWYSIWVLATAGLMVSGLKVPKLKSTGNRAMDIYLLANVVLTYLFIPFRVFPEYLWVVAFQFTLISAYYTFFMPASRQHEKAPFGETISLPPLGQAKSGASGERPIGDAKKANGAVKPG